MVFTTKCVGWQYASLVGWCILLGIGSLASASDTNANQVHVNVEPSLSISNDGLEWDRGFDVLKVWIIGKEERSIMQMPTPPRDFLFECLSETNKYKAAHVLLTYRYMDYFEVRGDTGWNGMWMGLEAEDEPQQMKKIQAFWKEKLKKGELESPVPVLQKDYLKRIFKIPSSSEVTNTNLQTTVDTSEHSTLTTNPPPQGAEGGSGSEESNR